MKKIVAIFLILILSAGCLVPAFALSEQKIFDQADLLTDDEEDSLQQIASAMASLHKMDVSILTIADAKGKTSMKYAEDFYLEKDMGYGEDYDGLLLLIDMDNREAYIATSGKAIRYFTDNRIDSILDDVTGLLSNESYAKAAGMFLDSVEYYLKQGIPSDQINYNTETGESDRYSNTPEYKMNRALKSLPIFILIGLGVGGAAVGIMTINNKGRKTTDAGTYLDRNSFTLMDNRDIFIRTATTKRYIDTSSGSRGGGSGGSRSSVHSSGGRSFGGGGRKF